jgi:hypothetical protein
MGDDELIAELYRRFHGASDPILSDRIAHLPIGDLPLTGGEGAPFGGIRHLVRGDDKSGAGFDIFRLGWFGGRVWELVVIDGAYLPHLHRNIDSEFFIFTGRGELSRDADWTAYQEKSRVPVGRGVAHGFITDPDCGATVFLSIQSNAIRKIIIDPNTGTEKFEDDFVYVDDAFPLRADLLAIRHRKLAVRRRHLPEPG